MDKKTIKKDEKNLSIRFRNDNLELLDKLHVVSGSEERSANKQVIKLIRDCVEEYEEKHGPIPITSNPPLLDKKT